MNMCPAEIKTVIGVDLGGSTTTAGVVDANLRVIASEVRPTNVSSQKALLDDLEDLVKFVAGAVDSPVAAVGIGIPSMIDRPRGRTVMSVNIPLAGFDFVKYMSDKLQASVYIDNDANLAALAEVRAGAARGASEAVMVTLGTGIGGGIIAGGNVYRGATGSAAELGHMVIDLNGPKCPGACPNYGCFEAMASGTALKRMAIEEARARPESLLGEAAVSGEAVGGKMLHRLAEQGDDASREVFQRLGFYLGITSLVNIFNPEFFVVGGGVIAAADYFLPTAVDILKSRGLKPNRDIVKVVPAHFGPEAGMLGAACLALEEADANG
jgi:glucokinase